MNEEQDLRETRLTVSALNTMIDKKKSTIFPVSFLNSFPLHSMLTTLGKYLLGIEVDHSTGKPVPVLKLLFPSNWLIPEDLRFIVEADYFSEEETLYYVGPAFEIKYMYLDDVVKFADDTIKYNDAVEAKKLELAELLRQKELALEKSIEEHRSKMEASGITFRKIEVTKPAVPVVITKAAVSDEPWADEITETFRPQPKAEDLILAPVVPRRNVPVGIDPAIFGEEDPYDDREIATPVAVPPMPIGRPSATSGLKMVAPLPQFDRNQVQVQRHDRDDNY